MSLLYTRVRREAMAWRNEDGEHHPVVHPVKHVGFAGHVGLSPEGRENWGMDENDEGSGHGFDEDAWDETVPEPTHEDQAHFDEHDEYPDDYHDRHERAYAEHMDKKKAQDRPDLEDDEMMDFIGNHGANKPFWHEHATHGPVDIKNQHVYATQSHVSQSHLDKYHANPSATTHRDNGHGDYLGDESPLMVTHRGILHAIEGHHRVGAALQRGDDHIHAWHFNADEHGGLPDSEGHMPDHEDYEEHWSA